jgi:hypothetical protein
VNGVRGASGRGRDYSEDSTRDCISDGVALNTKNQYQLSSNKLTGTNQVLLVGMSTRWLRYDNVDNSKASCKHSFKELEYEPLNGHERDFVPTFLSKLT